MDSSIKRSLSQRSTGCTISKRVKKCFSDTYFHQALKECGISLNYPQKCTTRYTAEDLIRNIKVKLEKDSNYPSNVVQLCENVERECEDEELFKYYLFPNIIKTSDDGEDRHLNDSVIKILLTVPILQPKMVDLVFQKAVDFAALRKCSNWIQNILKCFSNLPDIVDGEKISTNLINLLDITSEKMVKLQIITDLPDIVGDQELDNIISEMSNFLTKDHELIPAILDCLSYLGLSEIQYEQLQKKTLAMLLTFPKFDYYPSFIKFLFLPGRSTDIACLEVVISLRNAIEWPESEETPEITTSQVMTAAAIRNTMVSSELTTNAWLKVMSMCKTDTDHKPIDFIILLILFSTSDDKQKHVETLLTKQIKMCIFNETIVEGAFEKFIPILKDNLKHLINLANSLLKTKRDIAVQTFASHLYTLLLSKLVDCSQTIVAELLQLGLDSKQCLINILMILNKVVAKDTLLLKHQSTQMLTLLNRMDDMSLTEIRATMNLFCALAYINENSEIRDDINIMIRKSLGSSDSFVKIQGILAGIHAVKYLVAHCIDNPSTNSSGESPTDKSENFKEGSRIIELISRSTRQFPDMIAFFYDELSKIISSATYLDEKFMTWLANAVTMELQDNYIVNFIKNDKIGQLKVTMQYCLNHSELDETVAINIAELTLNSDTDISALVLSPLFELVQIIQSKLNDGDLSVIDALLGCPIVMPTINEDEIENIDTESQNKILDCLIHAINWFRELINAFANQTHPVMKEKTLKRLCHVEELELLLADILIKTKITYTPPICTFNVNKYKREQFIQNNQNSKPKIQKNTGEDQTLLSGTIRSQITQNINKTYRHSLDLLQNLPIRQLNVNLFKLLNFNLSSDTNPRLELSVQMLKYVLFNVNNNIQNILVSKIKRKTFLNKQEPELYDPVQAEKYAKCISEILPKIREHLEFITNYLDNHALENMQSESGFLLSTDILGYMGCLEYILNMLAIYFKWIGFQNSHIGLLKTSLRTITKVNTVLPQNELIEVVAKHFHTYEKYCLQLSTAVALIELIKSLQMYSNRSIVLKIMKDMSKKFLSTQWKSPDGVLEKGIFYNQSIDLLTNTYLLNSELMELRKLSLQLSQDIKCLKGSNDVLPVMKSISKANFSVLYKNIGSALYESSKNTLNKGMTNSKHLELWREVANILKSMSEIAKTLENRNNLSIFFKKSLPVLKLFMSQGVPILEIELRSKMEEVIEILKILQQSTRFLQSLCYHSRLKLDTVLSSKVPFVRHLLEQLIYKVKAALFGSNCPQAFWMGNLKNKNLHGEFIPSQSEDSEESDSDRDGQISEDDPSTDDEMYNPDSKSLSEIL